MLIVSRSAFLDVVDYDAHCKWIENLHPTSWAFFWLRGFKLTHACLVGGLEPFCCPPVLVVFIKSHRSNLSLKPTRFQRAAYLGR